MKEEKRADATSNAGQVSFRRRPSASRTTESIAVADQQRPATTRWSFLYQSPSFSAMFPFTFLVVVVFSARRSSVASVDAAGDLVMVFFFLKAVQFLN